MTEPTNQAAQTELPARRAFVLKIQRDCAVADGQFAGCVEHVSSGRRRRFGTLAELVAFLSQAVTQCEALEDQAADDAPHHGSTLNR